MTILKKQNLISTLNKLNRLKKKIVMCHGVFDVLHLGHVKHFEEAKKLGDILIVSVTSNKYVNKVIEPFETLAEMAKIDLDLNFRPKDILKKWIKNYIN